MKRKPVILLLVAMFLFALGAAYWKLTATPPSLRETASAPTPPAHRGSVQTGEGTGRSQLLGVWQDEYKGKRTMTLNEDGSGTMLVELSGAQAFLFAAKLRFDMKWSLDGKKLTKTTVGGEPADKVNLILNTMGNTAEDTILEVSESRLLLLDKDGKTEYDWRRVKTDAPSNH